MMIFRPIPREQRLKSLIRPIRPAAKPATAR